MASKNTKASITNTEAESQLKDLFEKYPNVKVFYKNPEGEFFDNKSYALASVNQDAELLEVFNRDEKPSSETEQITV